jgi:large subunit ribosomal protein L30
MARLRITQTRSTISHIARNRATIKALGLHGIGSTTEVPDNDAIRGMVRQVRFLVSVDEIADGAGTSGSPSRAGGRSKARDTEDGRSEARGSGRGRSEARGDAPASHRSEDSEDSEEKE